MSIFAISDLHLSFGNNKPMDIFGENWQNHEQKIKENWKSIATDDDLIILPGDFSWAMNLEDTIEDFKYLDELPGKKILLKGNHDYWWTSLKKMKEYLKKNNFTNIEFLYNNSFLFENKIIAGTRGWSEQETSPEKIIRRENIRLENSILDGIKKFGEDKEIIVCMHYPPFNNYQEIELDFVKTMKKYNVKRCIYGHLHGKTAHEGAKKGVISGINFQLVSSDYTDFALVKLQ